MTGRSSGRLSKTGSMVSKTCQASYMREYPDTGIFQIMYNRDVKEG